jgi:VWFA-related protein
MKVSILWLAIFWAGAAGFSQERIQEQVNVDWWVVPLFAVDADGNAVTDLKKEDMRLLVNTQPTDDFVLTRRLFDVEEKLPQEPSAPVAIAEKKRMIFLIFDIVFSDLENFKKSLEIAQRLVAGSAATTAFSIFTIDPHAGLFYLGGPLDKKAEVLALIQKKVVLNPRAKSIKAIKEVLNIMGMDTKLGPKYTADEMRFYQEELSVGLKNINKNYFRSLESLAYALNAIEDNKFVYLFTEGISTFSRQVIQHQDAEYRDLIRESADALGRSGAVLFIIDPAPVSQLAGDENSGEDSLRYLAEESGGKYLEGETQNIAQRIQNMHRAYYEIAFPDRGNGREAERKISVMARRPGVSVHTIRSLEKSKPYAELNKIEKEIFAVNLINRNPFFMKRLACSDAVVKKHVRSDKNEIYEIEIPGAWLGQKLDLYKAWSDQGSGNAAIEKSEWLAEKAEQKIEIDYRENSIARLAIINPGVQAALLQADETQKTPAPSLAKITEIKPMAEEFKYSPEMGAILKGAADYCDRLKQAAFHYYCSEKVVETLSGIGRDKLEDIRTSSNRAGLMNMIERSQRSSQVKSSQVNKYMFDYQLIKNGADIKEQRQLLSPKQKDGGMGSAAYTMQAFLSEKAVFAPITLFAGERQLFYEYRFVDHDKLNGVPCAVIEVLPRSREEARYVYGQAWIDLADHAVLKIKANPRSILGYEKLQALARQLRSRLFLNLEITFNRAHAGIRFPDRVVLSERYKGGGMEYTDSQGRQQYERFGTDGWERNRTEFTYKDYRFFEVGVQSTEKPQ